jgi:hypothetical protein
MKLTNTHGLPDAIVQAVLNEKYSRGGADYSTTELIAPARIVQLRRRYADEIEIDVSERVWSLLGSAVHAILDRANVSNALQEERIHTELLGRRISGASDLYEHDGTITDYKVTSVYTSIYGSRIEDWTAQLNIYAYLFRSIGFAVNRLQIVAIYRDWRASDAERNADYPRSMIEQIDIELWPEAVQRSYIEQRLQQLIDAESQSDDELPECTSEEMWERPASYAVVKRGNKTARRVLQTREEAEQYISEQSKPADYEIVHRHGRRIRCESYCDVSRWCSVYQRYAQQSNGEE